MHGTNTYTRTQQTEENKTNKDKIQCRHKYLFFATKQKE
jgi:hypothetical protein